MSVTRISFRANGRSYTPPLRPIVVICLDGSADEYLDAALARGLMPNLQQICLAGWRGLARGAMPSFTNVNNSSIITGVPPSQHGIQGNFFLDPATGQEVMMNSARFLRTETILAAAQRAGRKVCVVTAKDKLREILSAGLFDGGAARPIAFSSEKVNEAREETHGISGVEALLGKPKPDIYSGAASLYIFEAGTVLFRAGMADFFYLSTTDYIQHKCAPEDQEALDFYAAIDFYLGEFTKMGAVLGITADHGMNAKQKEDGSPNVIYLEPLLKQEFGEGFRVILPITDPYVVHHGALGSYAVVHLPTGARADVVAARLLREEGITEVFDKETAARKLELPADRIGGLMVLSGRNVVLGKSPEAHDLKALAGKLRSHGGRYEEMVPFILSEPLSEAYKTKAMGDPRNFDIFDFACNGTTAQDPE
jgi:phosphonoacetate hydrolase